jgi:hypothetical protein
MTNASVRGGFAALNLTLVSTYSREKYTAKPV